MSDQETALHDSLELFAESLTRYGAERYDFDARRAWLNSTLGYGPDAWRDFADMGWLMLWQAPDEGGFGGHADALCALGRAAGEHLFLEPWFGHLVLAGSVLDHLARGGDATAAALLAELATGTRTFAVAWAENEGSALMPAVDCSLTGDRLSGRKVMVLQGAQAETLLVFARDAAAAGAISVCVVPADAAGLARQAYRLLDGRGAATLTLSGTPATRLGPPGAGAAVFDAMRDLARLVLAAEAHGAITVLNRMTLAYLKERRQFGKPIGSNQALQHRMVEMYMLEQEVAAVRRAAQQARAAGRAEAAAAAAGALAQAMHAGRVVAHEAVQMHGGIGVTADLAVSHYFKRVMVINRLLGDRDATLADFAGALAGTVL